MKDFEALLAEHRTVLERFVRYRLPSADAEDVLQDVCVAAYQKFGQLRNRDTFKPWLLSIARNRCNDYYRARASSPEIALDALPEGALCHGRHGRTAAAVVRETLDTLPEKDRQILYLYFWHELTQAEIARRLGVPLGTVKSRLHTAKKNFRTNYPIKINWEGESIMKKLPERLPEYTIVPSSKPPFAVRCEELMGWMILPKPGEKITWGMYDLPERVRTDRTEMQVVGRAEVHGIEGVEIHAVQYDEQRQRETGRECRQENDFIAQLTDTHCRYLAESHMENGVRKYSTFLDGSSFLDYWGTGEDNCGMEIDLFAKGELHKEDSVVTGRTSGQQQDVVGRYDVKIGEKQYDTVCVFYVESDGATATESYLDAHGRTILWRRFNRNDWALERYGQLWTEKLPDNERLTINGETYVHWYDCITDYIL